MRHLACGKTSDAPDADPAHRSLPYIFPCAKSRIICGYESYFSGFNGT